jgi:hypothetical protein
MREGRKSSGASMVRGSGTGKFLTGFHRRGEGGDSDRWGPVDRETRERRPVREIVIRKGKRISRKDVTNARAGWVGRDCFGLRGTVRPVGCLGQRLNGPRGRPGRKSGKKKFLN